MSPNVDSVSRAHIDTELQYSFADRLAITERSGLNLTYPPRNSDLRSLVSEAFEPSIEWALTLVSPVNDQVEHRPSVA